MLVVFIGTMIVSFSRYSIERILGTDDLGIYATATAPAMIVQIAVAMIFAPLINLFADSLKNKRKDRFITIFFLAFGGTILFTFILAAGSHFYGEWGLNILYNDEIITTSAYLLTEAVFVAGLTASLWLLNYAFSATRDLKGILIGNIIGMIACLAGTDYFLIRLGLAGANYIMIISQGIAVTFLVLRLFWFIRKKRELFKPE